jgi:ADP-ribosylglycohydrolase
MTDTHEERLKRAYLSLEGLSVGDAFGGFYEMTHVLPYHLKVRELHKPPWRWTDDTNMALSIVAILRQFGTMNQDALALHFAKHYDLSRGYGMSTRALMGRIREGGHWRVAAQSTFGGQGSYGNGGAMRVAPLGAYFAEDSATVVQQANLSAEVTHAHLEGVAGAIAVAVAAAYAWQLRDSPPPDRGEFLEMIAARVPQSEVRRILAVARHLPHDTSVENAVKTLGNGAKVSAQDTVPFALWCAGEQLGNFEEAIWLTANGLGDTDTTCAIVGGIVSLYTGMEGIPELWRKSREPLPTWAFKD